MIYGRGITVGLGMLERGDVVGKSLRRWEVVCGEVCLFILREYFCFFFFRSCK